MAPPPLAIQSHLSSGERQRVLHHGAAHAPETHAAIEQVFDKRLSIHSVAGQWVVLPHP